VSAWTCAVCGTSLPSPMSFSGHFRHQHPGVEDSGRASREHARFWRMVDVRGEDDCWPWLAGVDGNGYGTFRLANGRIGAHRFALGDALGRPVPADLRAIHSCDNPPCCNPRHLREGTPKDNTGDMLARGRNRYGTRRGEQSPSARLTAADVAQIRALVDAGATRTACARMYGVSLSAVSSVALRKTWRHVA
jgi:hypothetical protein